MKNYYEILDLEPTATFEQIKEQYLLLLSAWHPEKFSDNEAKARAEEKVKDIKEAYSILSDSIKRAQYDLDELAERVQREAKERMQLESELEIQNYRLKELEKLEIDIEQRHKKLKEKAQRELDELIHQEIKQQNIHHMLNRLEERLNNVSKPQQLEAHMQQLHHKLRELEWLEDELEKRHKKLEALEQLEIHIEKRYNKLKKFEQLEIELELRYSKPQGETEVSVKREIKKILATIRKKYFQISVAHPKYLAKRFEALFLVQVFFEELDSDIKAKIKAIIGEDSEEHIYATELKIGQLVKVKLHSPDIAFSEPIVKKLNTLSNSMTFLGKPSDICQPGKHKVVFSIVDNKTEMEYQAEVFSVEVVDFAFDHVSRPLLSRASAIALGIGSFSMFILTFLEQIDKTIGLTSGTAVGVLALAVYAGFYNLYQRVHPSTP